MRSTEKGNLERLIVPGYGEEWLMNCPQCEEPSPYIHLISAKIHRCTDATTVNEKGVFVESITNPSPGRRGERIEIEYWCEFKHHHGIIALQFHKGEVFMQHEVLPKVEAGEMGEKLPNDIWRD